MSTNLSSNFNVFKIILTGSISNSHNKLSFVNSKKQKCALKLDLKSINKIIENKGNIDDVLHNNSLFIKNCSVHYVKAHILSDFILEKQNLVQLFLVNGIDKKTKEIEYHIHN